ncbi:MAG: glycoside hydrolase family 3 protein [Eudoraea sp.]|nr:glycoside hydrolase family 3 protein [Eudoraea sp.]NNJ41300.1 glycoside hydrolase family 3 protein [Eudoraea sp.]
MQSDKDISKQGLSDFSLEEKVGQFFMPAAFINDSEEEITQLEALIKNAHIGGICFFHSRASAATNYEGKKEIPYNKESYQTLKKLIARYQQAAKIPLLIAIDAEWGLAMRIENTPQYPYALTLGAIQGAPDLVYQVGRQIGADCRAAGIHWNFAPVADINNNPNNPVIGYRSFGSNKKQVAENAVAFARGLKSQGILCSAKHFPGHGDTATDSHLGLPVIDKSRSELIDNELFPFSELIEAGVDSVMIGHLAVPSLTGDYTTPTTLSEKMIKGTLRKEMGFQGVVVSDALNMHAVSKHYPVKGELEFRAFCSGIDILCFSENPKEGIQKIIDEGNIKDIEASFNRIWQLKSSCFESSGKNKSLSDPRPLNLEIARKSLTQFGGTQQSRVSDTSNWAGIQIGSEGKKLFFEKIKPSISIREIRLVPEQASISHEIVRPETPILLAIFPPSVKPAGSYGFSDTTLALMHDILNRQNVTVYLFGNPYFLNLLNLNTEHSVVIAYQDFDEFQAVAADHFLGRCKISGRLPVQLGK